MAEIPASLPRISYWLLPLGEDRDRLAKLIRSLAGIFGGPVFTPHLTVYSGPAGSEELGRILTEADDGGGELLLRCSGLEFSAEYTRSCFLGFAAEPRLNRFCETIRQNSGHAKKYQLNPHLSLFYGNLSDEDRQRISEMVGQPGTVRFGDVTAMDTSAAVRTGVDVQSWLLLESRRL